MAAMVPWLMSGVLDFLPATAVRPVDPNGRHLSSATSGRGKRLSRTNSAVAAQHHLVYHSKGRLYALSDEDAESDGAFMCDGSEGLCGTLDGGAAFDIDAAHVVRVRVPRCYPGR